jgi:hypothetical protein
MNPKAAQVRVKLLITNNSFCMCKGRQRSQKQDFVCGCSVAEAPPVFEASWSDCMYFSVSSFFSFVSVNFEVAYLTARLHPRKKNELFMKCRRMNRIKKDNFTSQPKALVLRCDCSCA